MNNEETAIIVLCVALFCSVLITGLTVIKLAEIKNEGISRGYALHCPTTGAWKWKGECK